MPTVDNAGAEPARPAAAYRPPALVVLGTVAELTLGSIGSMLDSNGRGSHGKSKKTK